MDTGVAEGDVVPPQFDSMIAKVIAWGADRNEALARLHRALSETDVVLAGGVTNKSFLLELLGRPEVEKGEVDTGWLDRLTAVRSPTSRRHAHIALVVAAIDAYDTQAAVEVARFTASAARGRPQAGRDVGQVVELRHGGHTYLVRVAKGGPGGWYRLEVDGHVLDVAIERLAPFRSRLVMGGRSFRAVSFTEGTDHHVEIDGVAHRLSRDDGGMVRAPAAAVVVAVSVAPDDFVEAGDRLVLVESMKMEVAITAPVAGRVRDVFVAGNVQVEAGAPLVRLEPVATDDGAPVPPTPRLRVDEVVTPDPDDRRARCLSRLEALQHFIAGFDLTAEEAHQLLDELDADRDPAPADDLALFPSDPAPGGDLALFRAELAILATFADLTALTRNRREDGADLSHSPREHFRSYLRSLDADREGLPDRFKAGLLRALAHYGIHDLAHTPELEEPLYRIFQAHQRSADHVPVVLAVLDRLAARADDIPDAARQELRNTLDRLIVATQLRAPVVGNLARSVRYRSFDQRVIERARAEGLDAARRELAYLAANPDAPDRAERVDRLVANPQPLLPLLADRVGEAAEPMLEILTRRYYKIRPLEHLRSLLFRGEPLITADYLQRAGRIHVVATRGEASRVHEVAEASAAFAADLPPDDRVAVDLYLARPGEPEDPDVASQRLAAVLAQVAFPPKVRRISVALCQTSEPLGGASQQAPDGPSKAVQEFTFRRNPAGFREDTVVRGLHPMINRRLHLWRLANFDLTRLPSAPDVYLFDCVAPGNASDERLIAVAEVRDITPVRDSTGQVSALPELEQVLAACLDSLRLAKAEHPAGGRLAWNRVLLNVSPPVETPLDELLTVAGRLAPLTEGLGIEQVVVQCRVLEPGSGELRDLVVRVGSQPGGGLTVRLGPPPTEPLKPLDGYTQKLLQARRRGAIYPYELVRLLMRDGGSFHEHDLDETGRLVPVSRDFGRNSAAVVIGLVTTPTARYPEGMTRVAVLGDPTMALGSLAEAECRRVLAAIDLADSRSLPVEWFAVSAGAKVALNSGSENLDWVGRVLRRLVEFSQAGGEVNVVVTGINVGAQPYWNAEATMLMHTRGILVMTPDSAMVLTGKQALDYAGGVSAEDNLGLGGYDRIMGPNGEAQYWAPDVAGACDILFAHYEHAYVAPGERFPRRAITADPTDRDVRRERHAVEGVEFRSVGDLFSPTANPDRKKPFDIRIAHAGRHRPRPRAARALGGHGRRRGGSGVRRPPRRSPGRRARRRVPPASPPRPGPGRRSRPVVGGHAVPPVVQEGGQGAQRRQREPAGRHPGQPLGLRRLARVAAQAPARVRRRDRPGRGQLRRAPRAVRRVPVPRRRLRGLLLHPERRDGGPGRRGLVRVRHRGRGRRRRRVLGRGGGADAG